MTGLIDFTGKKIVVIGASAGIGRQTALTLSTLGAQLILIARREEKLREVLQAAAGSGHAMYAADVSLTDGLDELFKKIKAECGPADGMVYCAGVNSTLPLQQLKTDKLREIFDVNFFAFVEAVRQITRRGRYNEGMRIVAVSSNAANRGDKAHTAYAASKAAMNAAVRCLARELADKGICINAVAPAVTDTEMYRQYSASGGGLNAGEQALLERQYLGLIEPEDVAEAIAYLLSPAARMLTGVTLPVDGGLSTS